LIVWGLFGVVAVAVLITYARVSPAELYDVSRSGIAGGASRTLVYLNFPVAFAAIALIGVATVSLLDHRAFGARRRHLIEGVAVGALLLCLIAALPGVVRQSDLDARPINALPAVGVALGLVLTVAAMRNGVQIPVASGGWRRPLAVIVACVLLCLSIPWILADIGVYAGDVPLIDKIFMSKKVVPPGSTLPAVHLGHHHGLDGAVFVIAALILGITLPQLPMGRLRTAIAWYLSLMVAYGLANFANDFWLEQVVKRGWTTREIPSMLRPELSTAWGLVLVGVIAARYVLFHPGDQRRTALAGALSISARRGN
jgi:hypothetical protein